MKRKPKKSSRSPSLSHKSGLSPGTPVFIGEQKRDRMQIDLIEYNADLLIEKTDITPAEALQSRNSKNITWVHVSGIHDIDKLQALAGLFGLHPLTVEDIVNTVQRPKIEHFDDYLFAVLRLVKTDIAAHKLAMENISLVLGDGFVLSFSEDDASAFNKVRERLRVGKGRMRKSHADYMAYVLMDAVVDQYFIALEMIGEYTDDLGDQIVDNSDISRLHDIHEIKRQLLGLRKSVWPLREEIGVFLRSESSLIQESTRPYLRDLYDHTIQIVEMVETERDILIGIHDIYLAAATHRLNEVMKVLTIIATIFIPLTFIVGIYGMNFDYMPELHWRWGYFVVLAIMATIAGGMLLAFRCRRWI